VAARQRGPGCISTFELAGQHDRALEVLVGAISGARLHGDALIAPRLQSRRVTRQQRNGPALDLDVRVGGSIYIVRRCTPRPIGSLSRTRRTRWSGCRAWESRRGDGANGVKPADARLREPAPSRVPHEESQTRQPTEPRHEEREPAHRDLWMRRVIYDVAAGEYEKQRAGALGEAPARDA